jgi:hypothetical protein
MRGTWREAGQHLFRLLVLAVQPQACYHASLSPRRSSWPFLGPRALMGGEILLGRVVPATSTGFSYPVSQNLCSESCHPTLNTHMPQRSPVAGHHPYPARGLTCVPGCPPHLPDPSRGIPVPTEACGRQCLPCFSTRNQPASAPGLWTAWALGGDLSGWYFRRYGGSQRLREGKEPVS